MGGGPLVWPSYDDKLCAFALFFTPSAINQSMLHLPYMVLRSLCTFADALHKPSTCGSLHVTVDATQWLP
jgi:hypothetical protein